MTALPVRVLMIWHHRVLGEAVAASLAGYGGLTVVAVSGSPDEALRLLAAERVDLVLLDASVDATAARDLVLRLQEDFPRVRVLPFGVPTAEAGVGLIEAGAVGCLSSEASLSDLAEEVLELRGDGRPAPLVLVGRVAARIEELAARSPPTPSAAADLRLSERELEVLALLARGLGNKEIARRLDIRTATVKNHVHAILAEMGVKGRREAVRKSYEVGLLRGPLRWRTLDEEE